MARPSFSSKLQVCLILVSCLFLNSCLELSTQIRFQTNSSGTIEVRAQFDRLAEGLTMLDGPDKVSFPRTKAEWADLVLQAPGITVNSYSLVTEDRGDVMTVNLSFANARALETLFSAFKQKLTLLQDVQGTWTLVIQPNVPRLDKTPPATRQLWADLWGDKLWNFEVVLPGGRQEQRRLKLADLSQGKPVDDWQIRW